MPAPNSSFKPDAASRRGLVQASDLTGGTFMCNEGSCIQVSRIERFEDTFECLNGQGVQVGGW